MTTYLILATLLVTLLTLAITNNKLQILFIAATAGIPILLFTRGSSPEESIGGISGQAPYVFIIFTSLIISTIKFSKNIGRLRSNLTPFCIFFLYALISILWSDSPIYGTRFFVKLFCPVLFLLLSYATSLNRSFGPKILTATLICCCFVAALSIINIAAGGIDTQNARVDWSSRHILTAPYMSPANYSFLISTGAIISFVLFLTKKSYKNLATFIILSAFVAAAFTRISMAALIVSTMISYFTISKSTIKKYLIPAFFIVSFIISLVAYQPLRDRMFFSGSKVDLSTATTNIDKLSESVDTSGRTFLWNLALEKFSTNNVMTGAGLGSVDNWLATKLHSTQLHSEYLRLYLDLGIVGILLYLYAIFSFLIFNLKFLISTRERSEKTYPTISISLLAFYLITLFTDNSFNYVSELGIYVYAAMGLTLAQKSRSDRARSIANLKLKPARLLINA